MNKTELKRCIVLRLDAGHDTNGNPRRLFLVMHPKEGIVAAIDEEYLGFAAIGNHFGKDIEGVLRSRDMGTVETTAIQYRRLLRDQEKRDNVQNGRK